MSEITIVGIAGGTGSGKTTFAEAVAHRLGSRAIIITHDNYYKAHHEMSFEDRTQLNYDHPDAYDTDLLVEHLGALRNGMSIEMPNYDFSIHDRIEKTTRVNPAPVILVEGILILADERLRDLMDIKIFVDADADMRILRRLARDVTERGRSVEGVIEQYLGTVKPMHEKYVEPTKRYADVIVPSISSNKTAQELLVARLN